MCSDIQLVPLARGSAGVRRFLAVPYSIYENDQHWVAPLISDIRKVFLDGNPLFDHAEMQLWVVTRQGRDVGRIAAILDRWYKDLSGRTTAFFGFFESVNDPAVARVLFQAVADWACSRGARLLLGPMNPSANDECGLLVDGFGSPPVFMMTYNPAYYPDLVEAEGFAKAKDLLAFHIDLKNIPMERLTRIADKVKQRNSAVSLRPILRKTLASDLGRVKEVYNAAWEDNWGFVPMSDAEVNFLADRLKPLLMEGLVWLAEDNGEPIGFLLATPNFNVPLKPLRGRLFTPRLFGFIPYLLGWKRPPGTRVITLGVKQKYRGKGLESAMLIEGLKVGFAAGFTESEASWILEDNVMMRRVLEAIGGRVYKTYRLYEKELGE